MQSQCRGVSGMSGERYLLDTNAIVALLQGNSPLIQLLQNPDWIGISVISQIEFMAFTGLTEADLQLFEQFIQRQYSGQFFRGAPLYGLDVPFTFTCLTISVSECLVIPISSPFLAFPLKTQLLNPLVFQYFLAIHW